MATLGARLKQDVFVDDTTDTQRNGATWLWVGEGSAGAIDETLVDFDISSIPLGSTINSATLQLYSYDGANDWSGAINVAVQLAGGAWNEATVLNSTKPTKVGAQSGAVSVSSANWGTYVSWDVAALLQTIMAGTYVWYGFYVLYTGTASSTRKEFRDKEYSNGGYKAKLDIDFTPPKYKTGTSNANIKATDFVAASVGIYTRVTAEMTRRGIAQAPDTYTNTPAAGTVAIAVEHESKVANNLNKIRKQVPVVAQYETIHELMFQKLDEALNSAAVTDLTGVLVTHNDCDTVCTGGCYTVCTATCKTACNNACGGTCTISCGVCSSACNTACAGGCVGCSTNCQNACTGACQGCNACTATCSGGCKACTTGCDSACFSCTVTCKGACSVSCSATCTYNCYITCAANCSTGCNGCSTACSGCSATCTGGCKAGCTGCTGCTGCNATCTGCTAGCTGGCTGCNACSGSCTAYCVSCQPNCTGGCYSCSATCTGRCESACTGLCRATCQSVCFASAK